MLIKSTALAISYLIEVQVYLHANSHCTKINKDYMSTIENSYVYANCIIDFIRYSFNIDVNLIRTTMDLIIGLNIAKMGDLS